MGNSFSLSLSLEPLKLRVSKGRPSQSDVRRDTQPSKIELRRPLIMRVSCFLRETKFEMLLQDATICWRIVDVKLSVWLESKTVGQHEFVGRMAGEAPRRGDYTILSNNSNWLNCSNEIFEIVKKFMKWLLRFTCFLIRQFFHSAFKAFQQALRRSMYDSLGSRYFDDTVPHGGDYEFISQTKLVLPKQHTSINNSARKWPAGVVIYLLTKVFLLSVD